MSTKNPFELLGDDAEDPSHQIAAEELKAAAVLAAAPKKGQEKGKVGSGAGQLPTKPLPPAQAVREARTESFRGGRGGGRGYGLRRGGFTRGSSNDENTFTATGAPANQGAFEGDADKPSERRGYGAPRVPYRAGGRRGGFSNGEGGEEGRPRRAFERLSGTGRGNGFKREGSGRGNWGTQTDEIAQVTDDATNETEKKLGDEKPAAEEDAAADANKESPANEAEEKEPEDKEMTLEEYEKVLEEKRKALQSLKTEQRKVDTKEFESLKPLSSKKNNHEIFAKLGSDKDKRKETLEKEEKSKKSVSINEFLKPAEGESYYNPGGRGRGRGRGGRGGSGFRGNANSNAPAPSIEDPGHFPTLGGK
ncbi:hypothetical protein TanjilG_24882 [Lupinus angustifolius]|uniref:Hyaluronan/mRNA-binding protein domain-containing protein n=1 Tax=Lupinus angustifolius TaxID=3871 RepID=A0A4P1R011_LUPAN|nr:PREDICTED: plasminogen activator inhibitor 1 RNA-binding protein-like [Lupinus angustifolius]OIV98711.1 hypothetical protein TanjilG_24882 [Lupinus angustifolius]